MLLLWFSLLFFTLIVSFCPVLRRWLALTAIKGVWRRTAMKELLAESCQAVRWRWWKRNGNPFSALWRAPAPWSAATPLVFKPLLHSRATTWSLTHPWRANTSALSASWLWGMPFKHPVATVSARTALRNPFGMPLYTYLNNTECWT